MGNFGDGRSPLVTPLFTPVVCAESMLRDAAFKTSMTHMVTTLCDRQATALTAVVDRAEFLEDTAMACTVSSNSHWYKAAIARRLEREALQDEAEEAEDHRYGKERQYEKENRSEKDGRRRAPRQDTENRRDRENRNPRENWKHPEVSTMRAEAAEFVPVFQPFSAPAMQPCTYRQPLGAWPQHGGYCGRW